MFLHERMTQHRELEMHLEKRVLITGGAGFLGSHLCERLLESEAIVVCVDISSLAHDATSSICSAISILRCFDTMSRIRFMWRSMRFTILLAPPRQSTISTIPCKQQRQVSTAPSICWVWRSACGREFFRRRHRKFMVILLSTRRPGLLGACQPDRVALLLR